MGSKRFELMKKQVASKFPEEQGERIKANMETEYRRLIDENKDIPESFVSHTRNNIFPVAAAFNSLIKEGMTREEAAKISDECFLKLMEAFGNGIRNILKVPGLYKFMPNIWKTKMPRLFGEEAGFKFSFYPTGKDRVKFDMLSCPYYDLCKKIGAPEIAPTFCSSDDICYGHMHKNLIWNRTKTMARGADCCDFDLYIKK